MFDFIHMFNFIHILYDQGIEPVHVTNMFTIDDLGSAFFRWFAEMQYKAIYTNYSDNSSYNKWARIIFYLRCFLPADTTLKEVQNDEVYLKSLRSLSVKIQQLAVKFLSEDACLNIFTGKLKVQNKKTLQKGSTWINLQRFDAIHDFNRKLFPARNVLNNDSTGDVISISCNRK